MLCNVCGDILIEDDTPAQKADDNFQRFKGVLLRTWYDITALQASAEIEGCDLCAMVWDSVKSYSREYEPSKLPQWIVDEWERAGLSQGIKLERTAMGCQTNIKWSMIEDGCKKEGYLGGLFAEDGMFLALDKEESSFSRDFRRSSRKICFGQANQFRSNVIRESSPSNEVALKLHEKSSELRNYERIDSSYSRG
jgi:hypothetical protein